MQEPVYVLLVEDTDADAYRIQEFLRSTPTRRYELTRATSLQNARDVLTERDFDIVLLDLGLPDCRGLEAIEAIHDGWPHLPIIVQSGVDACNGERAVRRGAQDFLPKGQMTPELLVRCIQYAIERKRAEHRLRVSEERYALAILGSHDGLWDWDLDSNTVFVSARWREIMGLTPREQEMTAAEWLECIHPDDRQLLLRAVHLHREGMTESLEQESRAILPDGDVRWTLVRGRAVRDENGRAVRLLGSMSDISRRKQAELQLRFHALHDQLTGTANRTLLLERARHAILRAQRNPAQTFALLFIDVDRFKLINDSLGHSFGDKLLVAFSQRLLSLTRPADTVARISGDEFAILLEDQLNANSPDSVAKRIGLALQQKFVIDGREIYLSVSVGIAIGHARQTPENLLRDADLAMYQAKKSGRSCFRVCDDQLLSKAQKRLQLELDMRTALEKGDFFLEYQPIVSMDRCQLEGFEALVRWRHPRLGIISPNDFIPIAEDTGLIIPLGEKLVSMALEALASEHPHSHVTMAVNLSPKQIFHPTLVASVQDALERTGIDPERLCIEVTENVFIEHKGPALEVFDQLRELGVRIHLDDFGTGYSSLSYLRQYPIDKVKIDRAFVSGLPHSTTDRSVILCIVELGRGLGFDVVAEGIETREQFDALLQTGCHLAQGYFCGRPQSNLGWQPSTTALAN